MSFHGALEGPVEPLIAPKLSTALCCRRYYSEKLELPAGTSDFSNVPLAVWFMSVTFSTVGCELQGP